ncbi:MAG TPA: winged helix-turn-helix domain-containing protein [Methylomirabilota bacterium]
MHTTRICSTTMVCMRPSGTGKQLERRRRHAIALLQAGVSYREVARQIGATLGSVVRWNQAHRRDRRNGLRARPIPGRPCRLSAAQQGQLKGVLLRGAEAAGYRTELWTLKRIGEVIRKQFGVRYSPVGVWALLRHGLGWSWQKPERRALERDEAAIAQWKRKEWPRLKKRRTPRRASRVPR